MQAATFLCFLFFTTTAKRVTLGEKYKMLNFSLDFAHNCYVRVIFFLKLFSNKAFNYFTN